MPRPVGIRVAVEQAHSHSVLVGSDPGASEIPVAGGNETYTARPGKLGRERRFARQALVPIEEQLIATKLPEPRQRTHRCILAQRL